MHEAKSQLSRLVERAHAGEEVVIARNGKPVAKLVPIVEQPAKRKLGQFNGRIWMADDWDSPETNAEIARLFYGE